MAATRDYFKKRYAKRKASGRCTACGQQLPPGYRPFECAICLAKHRAAHDTRIDPHRAKGVTPVRKAPVDDTVQFFECTGRKYVVRINDYYFGTIYCSTDELYTQDEVGVLGRMLACPMDHVPAKQRTALEQAVRENREGT